MARGGGADLKNNQLDVRVLPGEIVTLILPFKSCPHATSNDTIKVPQEQITSHFVAEEHKSRGENYIAAKKSVIERRGHNQLRRPPYSSFFRRSDPRDTGLYFPAGIKPDPPPRPPPILGGSFSAPHYLHSRVLPSLRLIPPSLSGHSWSRGTNRGYGYQSPLQLTHRWLLFVLSHRLRPAATLARLSVSVLPGRPFACPTKAPPTAAPATAPGLYSPLPPQRARSCRPSPARRAALRLPASQAGC